MTGTPGTIVAGFDGSARSRSAVDWAAGEAVAHGDSLRVISVFDWTRNAPTVRDASRVEEYRELALSMMGSRVDELGAECRSRYPVFAGELFGSLRSGRGHASASGWPCPVARYRAAEWRLA